MPKNPSGSEDMANVISGSIGGLGNDTSNYILCVFRNTENDTGSPGRDSASSIIYTDRDSVSAVASTGMDPGRAGRILWVALEAHVVIILV